jgi:hypothetical protein
MKQPAFLKNLEYSIPPSEEYFHVRENLYRDYFKIHLPL